MVLGWEERGWSGHEEQVAWWLVSEPTGVQRVVNGVRHMCRTAVKAHLVEGRGSALVAAPARDVARRRSYVE